MTKTINTRPITIFSIIGSLHTVVYGLGFLLGTSDFTRTVLYKEVTTIMPPEVFGIIAIVVAVIALFGFFGQRRGCISVGTWAQVVLWLFVTLVYFLYLDILLGLAIGATWTVMFAYSAYLHKNDLISNS